jgi:translation initiation factor 3 subunit G
MAIASGDNPVSEGINSTPVSESVKSNKFVPSALAKSRTGTCMGNVLRHSENSIRITNLTPSAREEDMRELFGPFGRLSRVHVPYHRGSEENRGFAFVDFLCKEDARRAIEKLDGWGYDHLILKVEWAINYRPRGEAPVADD